MDKTNNPEDRVAFRVVFLARELKDLVGGENDADAIRTIDLLIEDLEWLRKEIGER